MGDAHVPAEQPPSGQAPRLPAPHVDQGRAGHHPGPAPEGPAAAVGLIWRVRDRSTFLALRQSGRRVRRGPITVTFLPGDPTAPPRVAYAVGRRVGGAVVRNRIRRRLRAVVSDVRGLLRPGTYLIGAAAAAADLPYGELTSMVSDALTAALPEPAA